jgi:hypothetical protein
LSTPVSASLAGMTSPFRRAAELARMTMSVEGQPENLPPSWIDRALRLMLAGCWLASLFLPAAWSTDDTGQWNHYNGPIYGVQILLTGWAALMMGQPGWLANLFFFPALLLPGRRPSRRRRKISITLLVAIILCLIGTLSWRSESYSLASSEMVSPYGAGWWFWVFAITGAAIRLAALLVRAQRVPALSAAPVEPR